MSAFPVPKPLDFKGTDTISWTLMHSKATEHLQVRERQKNVTDRQTDRPREKNEGEEEKDETEKERQSVTWLPSRTEQKRGQTRMTAVSPRKERVKRLLRKSERWQYRQRLELILYSSSWHKGGLHHSPPCHPAAVLAKLPEFGWGTCTGVCVARRRTWTVIHTLFPLRQRQPEKSFLGDWSPWES